MIKSMDNKSIRNTPANKAGEKEKKYYKTIKLNVAMHGYREGQTARIKTNCNGMPLVREWRNRFRDVKLDNSFEFVADGKPPCVIPEPKKEITKNEAKKGE